MRLTFIAPLKNKKKKKKKRKTKYSEPTPKIKFGWYLQDED